jgi:hypothetical protein
MKKQLIPLLILFHAAVTGCSTPDVDPFGGGGNLESIPKWRYQGDLHGAMSAATRLRLSIGSPGRTFEPPLVDTTDPTVLADMEKHIVFNKTNPMATCACLGSYTFEWLRGNELLAQVTLHVGSTEMHMRWGNRWEGDAWLTSDSELWLSRYMMYEIMVFTEGLNGANQRALRTR